MGEGSHWQKRPYGISSSFQKKMGSLDDDESGGLGDGEAPSVGFLEEALLEALLEGGSRLVPSGLVIVAVWK